MDLYSIPRQLEFEQTAEPLVATVERIARAHFPQISTLPVIHFGDTRRPAFIVKPSEGRERPYIIISSMFNSRWTPKEIIESIVVHELLHLLIPGREVEGKKTDHPPEFFEEERRVNPGIGEFWGWFVLQFGSRMVKLPGEEGYLMRPRAYREVLRDRKRLSMERMREILDLKPAPAGAAQYF